MPDGASIILNAPIVASKGLPKWSVYSATKAAVRSFARTGTTDLRDRRIRVNAVSPGFIDTPGLNDLLASSQTHAQGKKVISDSAPFGRFGTPDEIAKAVVFVASDDGTYITERNCLWTAASRKSEPDAVCVHRGSPPRGAYNSSVKSKVLVRNLEAIRRS